MIEAISELVEDDLQNILKKTLQDVVSLAKKRIRSKKGLAELQSILVDYHQNKELALIIKNVVRLVNTHQSTKREETEESPAVLNDQYKNLEEMLQKHQASVRQHIRNEQQLKLYCDEIDQKNKELMKSNEELLKSTKQTIIGLKRENQKLVEQNHALGLKIRQMQAQTAREREKDDVSSNRSNKIRTAKKYIDIRDESGNSHWTDKYEISELSKGRKSSISSIRQR